MSVDVVVIVAGSSERVEGLLFLLLLPDPVSA
jgi:hypothetical protein